MSINLQTEVALMDARTRSGILTLPLTSAIPNRMITVKDFFGMAQLSTISVLTTSPDVFDTGGTTIQLTNNLDSVTLIAGPNNRWAITEGTQRAAATITTLSTSIIRGGIFAGSAISTGSISAANGFITNLSAINALALTLRAGGLSTTTISAASLVVSSISATTAYFSSLTVDALDIGGSAGFLNIGDAVATSVSSVMTATNTERIGSTINMVDQTSGAVSSVYSRGGIMYYGPLTFAGVRTAPVQFITF